MVRVVITDETVTFSENKEMKSGEKFRLGVPGFGVHHHRI
jgi:hypothetical protein